MTYPPNWDHLLVQQSEITAVAARSQFDCSVPLQILAVEIMFFDAYYVTYFKKKKSESL